MQAPRTLSFSSLQQLCQDARATKSSKRAFDRFIERQFGNVHRRVVVDIPVKGITMYRARQVRADGIEKIAKYRESADCNVYPDIQFSTPKVITVKPEDNLDTTHVLRYEFDIQFAGMDTESQRFRLLETLSQVNYVMGLDEWSLPATLTD